MEDLTFQPPMNHRRHPLKTDFFLTRRLDGWHVLSANMLGQKDIGPFEGRGHAVVVKRQIREHHDKLIGALTRRA